MSSITTSPRTANKLEPSDWDSWAAHLAERRKPKSIYDAISNGKSSSLLWAIGSGDMDPETKTTMDHLFQVVRRKKSSEKRVVELLERWLDDVPHSSSVSQALLSLAWCHALPRLVELIPAAAWSQSFDRLQHITDDAKAISLDDAPLVQQLLAGELAFTLAYLFPELEPSDDLRESARTILSVGADDLLDGRGLPHAGTLPIMRPLLACWTRCSLLARAAKTSCLSDRGQIQYEWLVRQALRCSRGDGSQVFGTESKGKWEKHFLAAVLSLSSDPDDDAIANVALPSHGAKSKSSSKALPDSAYQSEWSETAILRSKWTRKSPSLTVTYADRTIRSELNVSRETLWSGSWMPTIYINETEMRPQSEWAETCWHSDKDVDYIELEIEYSEDWKLQRQLLLARKDSFLIAADALLGKQSGRIDYRCTLPTGDELGFDAATETREGFVYRKKRLGLVIPLALPEWRSELVDDGLSLTSSGLTLHQQNVGSALYAPLWFDLNPSRQSKELTWRTLTVAEQLRIQPRDTAVGYRVQVGKSQWLVYRSLAERQSRTLLGQNLFCEFFVARFLPTGETEELLQIE